MALDEFARAGNRLVGNNVVNLDRNNDAPKSLKMGISCHLLRSLVFSNKQNIFLQQITVNNDRFTIHCWNSN